MIDSRTIQLSAHAMERYRQRRGRKGLVSHLMRDALARVAHQNPPLTFHPQYGACRRYVSPSGVWIVDADDTAVITYLHGSNHPKQARLRAKARRAYT